MEFSQRAIWEALNSEHGDRLIEIALEHIRLVNKLPPEWNPISGLPDPFAVTREILKLRIEQLKQEQEEIISQFED